MRIREARHDWGAAIAAAALLSGCGTSQAPDDQGKTETAITDPKSDCLLMVWSEQENPDVEFDRANDLADGGAISCATGTSASEYRAAVTAIRTAAASGDRAQMLEQVGIPLVYFDAAGKRRELRDPAAINAVFDDIFDPEMLALMRDLDLKRLTVENQSGGFFSLGALWLVPDGPGGRPRIVTLNRQALAEAIGEVDYQGDTRSDR